MTCHILTTFIHIFHIIYISQNNNANDTDLYNSGAVHHLRDQSPVTQGNHNLQICSLHKSVIWWEIVARSELQCLGQDESCGYGAVGCVCGEMGYVAIVLQQYGDQRRKL